MGEQGLAGWAVSFSEQSMSIPFTVEQPGISNGRIRYQPSLCDAHVLVNTSAGTADPIRITNIRYHVSIGYPARIEVAGYVEANYSNESKPLSDAMRLAIAVLSGDERAALLLADEVQLNYLRR